MPNKKFWAGKNVFVTGHTGFKGSWLTLWLSLLGARVTGYSINVPTIPSLYEIANVSKDCQFVQGDITNYLHLSQSVGDYQPEIVFHMAAQPLVRKSYHDPIETYLTNVMGTVHILEAARKSGSIQVIVNVTSDKCYENTGEIFRHFVESDRMGGHDPYSASKGCAELVTESFQRSFFKSSCQKLASVRAGNVIGGGDWAEDRLVPDIVRSIVEGTSLSIRNPYSIRPWQHVLEPLSGYLCLVEHLWESDGYEGGWNFGPSEETHITVNDIINLSTELWGQDIKVSYNSDSRLHEANLLRLDSSKAFQQLGWKSKLSATESVKWTVEWYKEYTNGCDMRNFTLEQIGKYQGLKGEE